MQRLESDAAGRPILRKVGGTGAEADRLRGEAEALRAAAHPGVVQLVSQEEAADGTVALCLAVAGTRTFADLRTDLPAAARALAGLATTVADLHDLGLVHGRIRADHVVLDGAGRAVLCGFAEAGPRGPRDPADDVHGLGTLLSSILSRTGGGSGAEGEWEPIPERRFGRGDRWSGFVRRALLTLADQATADDPAQRPSARGFAASVLASLPPPSIGSRPPVRAGVSTVLSRARGSIGGAVAAARSGPAAAAEPPAPLDAVALLMDGEDGGGSDRPPWRRPPVHRLGRLAAPVGGALGLGLLVFGIGALLRPAPVPLTSAAPDATASTSEPPAPTTTSPTVVTAVPTDGPTSPPSSPPAPPTCTAAPPPTADPDGDGCPSTALVGDGVVEVDGVRYGVGRPGDLLAVGDWDCDGRATVALVHRGSGEVFVFDRWATGAADATATSRGTVPGAERIEPAGGPAGCSRLVVVDEQGERTEVPA